MPTIPNDIKKLQPGPGDVVIVKYAGCLPMDAKKRLVETVTPLINGAKVLVLDCGMECELLRERSDRFDEIEKMLLEIKSLLSARSRLVEPWMMEVST